MKFVERGLLAWLFCHGQGTFTRGAKCCHWGGRNAVTGGGGRRRGWRAQQSFFMINEIGGELQTFSIRIRAGMSFLTQAKHLPFFHCRYSSIQRWQQVFLNIIFKTLLQHRITCGPKISFQRAASQRAQFQIFI